MRKKTLIFLLFIISILAFNCRKENHYHVILHLNSTSDSNVSLSQGIFAKRLERLNITVLDAQGSANSIVYKLSSKTALDQSLVKKVLTTYASTLQVMPIDLGLLPRVYRDYPQLHNFPLEKYREGTASEAVLVLLDSVDILKRLDSLPGLFSKYKYHHGRFPIPQPTNSMLMGARGYRNHYFPAIFLYEHDNKIDFSESISSATLDTLQTPHTITILLKEGKKKNWEVFTKQHTGKMVTMLVNDSVASNVTIGGPIPNGKIFISAPYQNMQWLLATYATVGLPLPSRDLVRSVEFIR
jgi:hypothetical protein